MPRPRSSKYRDLPEGLYFKGKKGYVFRRIDNSSKSLGHDKSRAIALARRYNATYRVDPEISHPVNLDLIKPHHRKSVARLSSFFDRVSARYADEEKPTKSTLDEFDNRLSKLKTLIGDRVGMSITLDDVNMVLDVVAAGKSNNVFNRWIAFMSKVFDYAVDESVMVDNPAKRKSVSQRMVSSASACRWRSTKPFGQLLPSGCELQWIFLSRQHTPLMRYVL